MTKSVRDTMRRKASVVAVAADCWATPSHHNQRRAIGQRHLARQEQRVRVQPQEATIAALIAVW